MLNRTRVLAVLAAGAITITGVAGLAGAKKGVNQAAGGVRSDLFLVGGEDPSIPAGTTPAAADARFTGKVSKIAINTMDGARFPLTVRNQQNVNVSPCVANLAIGSLVANNVALEADPVTGRATIATFSWDAPSSAGAATSIDVVCDWTDRKGVVNHHETHWAGTL